LASGEVLEESDFGPPQGDEEPFFLAFGGMASGWAPLKEDLKVFGMGANQGSPSADFFFAEGGPFSLPSLLGGRLRGEFVPIIQFGREAFNSVGGLKEGPQSFYQPETFVLNKETGFGQGAFPELNLF
jgi:hypothetical protein